MISLSRLSLTVVLITVLLLISTSSSYASDTWFVWEAEGAGQFLHKEGKKYRPVSFPTEGDQTYSSKKIAYYVRDGFIGMGYRKFAVKTLDYNLNMAELMYYILNKADLPKVYEDIDCAYTTYTREDFMLDLYWTHGPLQLITGVYLMDGSDPFQLEIIDGTSGNSEEDLLEYSFLSLFSLYKGYQIDVGSGLGGHFALTYQPTKALSFSLSADNLGTNLVWRDVDHYKGKFDLDIVKTDDNGFESIDAPLKGTYESTSFTIPLVPIWRGEVTYEAENWQVENWVQYSTRWEYGLTSTVLLTKLPDLSLGVSRQHNRWLYSVGLETPNIRVEFGINSLEQTKQTTYTLSVQTHLF